MIVSSFFPGIWSPSWRQRATGIWASAFPHISLYISFLLTGYPSFPCLFRTFFMNFHFSTLMLFGSLLIQTCFCLSNMSLRSALHLWASYLNNHIIYSHQLNSPLLCPQEKGRAPQEARSDLPCPCWIPESIRSYTMFCTARQQPQKG